MRKSEILEMATISYWSGVGGLEIKLITDDYVYFVSGSWTGNPKAHKAKLCIDKENQPYFKCNGYNVYLYDCIRV